MEHDIQMTALAIEFAGEDIHLTRGGLVFGENVEWDTWVSAIAGLRQIRDVYHSCLADAIAFGRAKFGDERVEEILEQKEFDFSDVNRAKAIGGVEYDLRLEFAGLRSDHFFVVAKKFPEDPANQRHWLAVAAKHSLGAADLKTSVETGKVFRSASAATASGRQSAGILTIESIVGSFHRWEQQVGGPEKIVAEWNRSQKEEFLRKTEEIAELRAAVESSISKEKRNSSTSNQDSDSG